MSYFTAMFARGVDGHWSGLDPDLDLVRTAGLDDLVETMHDSADDDQPVIVFVEENDEWFGIIRVDGEGEPRVFISDLRAPLGSELAAMIHEGIGPPEDGEEESDSAPTAAGEPGGDIGVLADLSVSSEELTELCVEEGMLPADVLAALADRLGFAEELDRFG